jgi:ATP-dependent RNA/DNA helicase IGHMBP2
MKHFETLQSLLKKEKEEDLAQFIQFVQQRPLHERVREGYTWYPLKIVQAGFALGEKAFVIVERTTNLNQPHQLRSGMSVRFFSQAAHVNAPEKTGVINFVERNKMKIVLNSKEVPDWIEFGLLGVDMLFDDRTYREMETALSKVLSAKGDRLSEFRRLLTEPKPSDQEILHLSIDAETKPDHLNASQQTAVEAILANKDIVIIHGPPGTGKTTTVVAAITQLAQRENTILVTAPSNTAADLLTERIAEKGLQVVRIGNISRVDDAVIEHTLEALLSNHPESKNIRKVKLQAAEYRRQSQRFKRTFGAEERRERNQLKEQAKELDAWAQTLEDRLVDEILSGANAIVSTLVGAANPILNRYKFRTCIIDEAAQALEPACWIPIAKCSRLVLAGDPFQLPPTVKSRDAAKGGLAHTLIERAITLLPTRVYLLQTQYRMNQAIMNFSNQWFYDGQLSAASFVGDRRLLALDDKGETLTVFDPVVFVDTAGCGFEEKLITASNSRSQSRFNQEEALLLREHLLQLTRTFEHTGNFPDIGILSPYREQINFLEETLRTDPILGEMLLRTPTNNYPTYRKKHATISVNTIDGFQGQERDVIYISLVRSNTKNEIGFLSDYRRMNVAMTRARKLLVIIGDSSTIGNNKFYQALLEYCEKNGRYQTAWEYMR